jgi:hypothetical protein
VLGLFATTSRRYAHRHVRVGDTTRSAERHLHRRALAGCEEGFYLNAAHTWLDVSVNGGRAVPAGQGVMHVAGGHVGALVLHSRSYDPGIFDCL